jgi:hypothetical protein
VAEYVSALSVDQQQRLKDAVERLTSTASRTAFGHMPQLPGSSGEPRLTELECPLWFRRYLTKKITIKHGPFKKFEMDEAMTMVSAVRVAASKKVADWGHQFFSKPVQIQGVAPSTA